MRLTVVFTLGSMTEALNLARAIQDASLHASVPNFVALGTQLDGNPLEHVQIDRLPEGGK